MRKSADRGPVLHFCMHGAPPPPGGSRGKQTVEKPEGGKGETNAVCGCPDKKGKQMQFVVAPTKRERQKGETNAVRGYPDKKGKQMQFMVTPTKRENKCSLWLSRHTDAVEENTAYEV